MPSHSSTVTTQRTDITTEQAVTALQPQLGDKNDVSAKDNPNSEDSSVRQSGRHWAIPCAGGLVGFPPRVSLPPCCCVPPTFARSLGSSFGPRLRPRDRPVGGNERLVVRVDGVAAAGLGDRRRTEADTQVFDHGLAVGERHGVALHRLRRNQTVRHGLSTAGTMAGTFGIVPVDIDLRAKALLIPSCTLSLVTAVRRIPPVDRGRAGQLLPSLR